MGRLPIMPDICQHTDALDELTVREQRDEGKVLRALHRAGRFSVFEATANQGIADVMTYLHKHGLIEVTPRDYPWSDVKLTERGLRRAGL